MIDLLLSGDKKDLKPFLTDNVQSVAESRIAEEGSYTELMKKGGRFAQLVRRQMV